MNWTATVYDIGCHNCTMGSLPSFSSTAAAAASYLAEQSMVAFVIIDNDTPFVTPSVFSSLVAAMMCARKIHLDNTSIPAPWSRGPQFPYVHLHKVDAHQQR